MNYVKTRTTEKLAAVILLTSCVFGLLFFSGYAGSSAARIKREHGIKLPSSARNFVCRGDAWMHIFIDSGAASAFEMASSDLSSFISQLKVHRAEEASLGGSIFPTNSEYPIQRPWMSGVLLKTYQCASPTGDSLSVQVWAIDETHVGVLLYTDWN